MEKRNPCVLCGNINEGPICMVTEEEIGKSTTVIEERLMLVPELKEVPGGEVAEEDVMQEVVGKIQ